MNAGLHGTFLLEYLSALEIPVNEKFCPDQEKTEHTLNALFMFSFFMSAYYENSDLRAFLRIET